MTVELDGREVSDYKRIDKPLFITLVPLRDVLISLQMVYYRWLYCMDYRWFIVWFIADIQMIMIPI